MSPLNRTVRDGLVVGLIAYASVALFYSAFAFLAARGPFYTVDLLGKAMFQGLRDPAVLMFSVTRDPTAIFLYNAFHLAMSLGIGVVVTSLIEQAERHPSQALLIVVMLVAGGVLTVFAVAYLTESVRPLLHEGPGSVWNERLLGVRCLGTALAKAPTGRRTTKDAPNSK